MINKKSLIFLIFIFIFTGCESKKTIEKMLNEDKVYKILLNKTQKLEIINSFQTKSTVIVTYLDKYKPHDSSMERFLVAFYINDSELMDNFDLTKNSEYKIFLNNKVPLEIIEVSKDDKVLRDIPYYQKWYKYYYVNFKKENNDKLEFLIKHETFGMAYTNFLKD
ncbi:MAG: hypothetical protein HXX81_04550 [Campylobacterales bacterium]|nr:hypothetical protein [Campylobacterales bacterium]